MADEFVQDISSAAERQLRADLGDGYDRQVNGAREMLKGLTSEQRATLEGEMGTRAYLQHAVKLRNELFPGFEAPRAIDPALAVDSFRAAAEIEALQGDPEFMKRYVSDDPLAREQMQRMYMRAFPQRRS